MKYLLCISILTLHFAICFGQRFNQKLYNSSNGLTQTECGLPFVLYDSTCIVSEISNELHTYDGYRFRPLKDIDMQGCCIGGFYNFEDFSVIVDNDRCIFYENGKFTPIKGLPALQVISAQSIYVAKDTFYVQRNGELFYLKKDSIKFKKYAVSFNFNSYKIDKSTASYSESFDKNLIKIYQNRFTRIFSKKNNKELSIPEPIIKGIAALLFKKENVNISNFPGIINNLRSFTDNEIIEQNRATPQLLVHYKQDTVFAIGQLKNINGSISKVNNQLYLQGSHQGFARINPHVHFIPEDEKMVSSLHTILEHKGEIYFGSYGNGFSIYKDYQVSKMQGWNNMSVMPGGISHSNGNMFVTSDGNPTGFYEINKDFKSIRALKKHSSTGYTVKELSDKSIVVGTLDYTMLIFSDIKNTIKYKTVNRSKGIGAVNILGIEEDKNGRLWYIGAGVGIYDRKRDTAYHFKKPREVKYRVGGFSIARDHKGTMWFGTNTGIQYLRNADIFDPTIYNIQENVTRLTLPNGSESQVTFMNQVDSFMVFGTFSSVNFLNLNSFYRNLKNPIIHQLIYGEDIEGGGSEQNCVLFDSQRRLWIGTQEGALMIEWDKFRFDHTKSKIKIYQLQAGDDTIELISSKTKIYLPANKRNLKISFGLDKNISLLKNVFFDYQLVSSNGDTLLNKKYEQNGELALNYLRPDTYTLNIKAKKHGQLMDEMKLTIIAKRSLAELPWFWAALFGILLFFSILFLRFRNKARNEGLQNSLKLSKLSSEKDLLKVQSIISTFNPHFINNSLHWIQSRHIDDEDTVNLVGDLSENIRYIFESTKNGKAIHSLDQELKLVQNYVNVQLLRFGNSFKYLSPANLGLNQYRSIALIIMQLQIHVENAIEHGLRNRKLSSYVKLDIEEKDENISFIIEDDGCGRKIAKERGSKGTQMGTKMLSELHQIFNEQNNNKITTIYEDEIFEKNGESYGTRVKIIVPKNFDYSATQTG